MSAGLRSTWTLAMVVLLGVAPRVVPADGPHPAGLPPGADKTPEAAAAEVRAALAKGDAEMLGKLAKARVPSPFAVADELFGDFLTAPPGPDAGASLRAYAAATDGNAGAKGLPALIERWIALTEEERAREARVRTGDQRVLSAMIRMKFAEAAEIGAATQSDAIAAMWSLAAFRLLVNTAIANQRLGRLKVAEDSFAAGALAAERAGHIGASAKSELEAALLARSRGDVALALARAERAQARLERVGAAGDAHRAQCLVARTLANSGWPSRALPVAEDALAKAKARGDSAGEGEAWATLAEVHTSLGADREADIEWASEAALAEKSGSRERILRCLMNRASALVSVRRFADAIEAYERALAKFAERPYPRGESTAERQLAMIYGRLGRSDAALDHARRALAAADASKSTDLIDEADSTLALALGVNGRREDALAMHRRQVEARHAAGDRVGTAVAKTNVAWQLAALHRIAEAIPVQEEALGELEAAGDRLGVERARGQLADYYEVAGENARALALARRVVDAGAFTDPRGVNTTMVRRVLARVLLRSGRLDEAIGAARALADEQRDWTRGLDEEDAVGLRSDARMSCEVGLRAALDIAAKDPARAGEVAAAAFEFAEAARGLLLAEGLANASGLLAADLPPELVAADAASRQALDLARRMALAPAEAPTDAGAPRSAVETLSDAWKRRDEVVQRMQRASRRAATWVVPPPADPTALRAALDDRTVFVMILGLADRSLADLPLRACAVVISKDGIRLIELPRAAEASDAVDAFLRVARTPGTDDAAAAAKAYDILFRPVEAAVEGKSRLVLVPDGGLSFLPFESLLRVEGEKRDRLVERFEISYAPSAGVWLALQPDPKAPPGDRVLAVGDPAQGPSTTAAGLPALPSSALEARDVTDSMPAERRSLLVADGATIDAVESAVRAPDARFRVLHFACHGLIDPARARGTGLLLANGEVLDVDRLARWRVAADLAVLSACESARGKLAHGEGVFGLPRAFFLSGVPRVIVSHWVVYDQTTRAFMQRFYDGYLRGGLTPAAALCEAKRAALRAGGAGAHPSAWAPFVLWGVGN